MTTVIVALKYKEKAWEANTLPCLLAAQDAGYTVIYADRDGVGNMAKAFNDAVKSFIKHNKGPRPTAYWFVTNITFTLDDLAKLEEAYVNCGEYAAIHPEFDSDHGHIRPDGSTELKRIPFIEFTAPLVDAIEYESIWLDEDHHYYYFDLIFSKRLKDKGLAMACHHGVKIGHVYLRNNEQKEAVSLVREQMRNKRESVEIPLLRVKFGPKWREIIWDYKL